MKMKIGQVEGGCSPRIVHPEQPLDMPCRRPARVCGFGSPEQSLHRNRNEFGWRTSAGGNVRSRVANFPFARSGRNIGRWRQPFGSREWNFPL